MDIPRFVNIVLSDLSLENLKLQDKLEIQINTKESIDVKLIGVKGLLQQLVLNELMMTKFKLLVPQTNETQNPTEMDKFNELHAKLNEMKEDVEKFYARGNKSAGVRIRQKLQDIKALAQEMRKEISEYKKNQKDENN